MDRSDILSFWLRQNGVEWNTQAIELHIINNHNAAANSNQSSMMIRSKTAIAKGSTLAIIPKSIILSARNSAIGSLLKKNRIGGGLALVLVVMYEISLRDQSKWFGYLQSLPDYERLPFLWPPNERKQLQGTEVAKALISEEALLESDYRQYVLPLTTKYPKRFPRNYFSIDQFKRCSSVVAARYFHVDLWYGDAMVPLADVFNHRTGGENIHLESNSDSEEIELSVYRAVSLAGQEVFNTYGDHSNAYLLMKYGFTESDNPFNVVSVDCRELLNCVRQQNSLPLLILWWAANREQLSYAWDEKSCDGIDFDNDYLLEGTVDYSADAIDGVLANISFNIHADGSIDWELRVVLKLLQIGGQVENIAACLIMDPFKVLLAELDCCGPSMILADVARKRTGEYLPIQQIDNQFVKILVESEIAIWQRFLGN